MSFDFLDKDGTKQFRNALNYLIDEDLITNASQKTMVNTAPKREKVIVDTFKNLTAEDKRMLIKEILEIEREDKTKIVNEIIKTFIDFKTLDEKESIANFLYDLMKNINDKKIEQKIFNLIYLNYPPCALEIINETEIKELKKELCKLCISLNLERGYIYKLLCNTNYDISKSLDNKKLINEINYIQSFSKDLVLKKVFMDYNDTDSLIKEINNRILNEDFKTIYTLAKNIELLTCYKFNIDEKELKLLKEVIDITYNNKEDVFKCEEGKKKLESYSTEWLLFLSMNLLKMDYQKQEISIMILNDLLDREDFMEKHQYKVAEEISLYIKEHKENRGDLLRILGDIKVTKGFYNIMDIVDEEGLVLLKDNSFKRYINQVTCSTREFKWLYDLEKSQKYKRLDLNIKALIFVLMEKTPKQNYELLKLLEEHDKDLYLKLMENIEEVIANKLDGYEKYIKSIIALNYKCKNEDILNLVKEYNDENRGAIISYLKVCDPSFEFLEKYYNNDIKEAIEKNDNNIIINLIKEIEEIQVKNKCSYLLLENLVEKDFDKIPNIWEYLVLDLKSKINFKEKVLKMIDDEEIQLTKKNIAFINEVGIEPETLYSSIKDYSNKKYLLDIWYHSNELGKIINIVREVMIDDAKSLKDLEEICVLLDDYNINDNSINLLIKIKVYNMISVELLELDIMSGSSINRLNKLSKQLISYGLVDRFLMDNFLQKGIDKRIVDYLFRSFMNSAKSKELWQYYWNYIMEDLKMSQYNLDNEKMEIFLNYLTKSKQGIEWFLDIISRLNIDQEIYMYILETLLILLNKQKRIIIQNQHELDQMKEEILTIIGKNISKSLSNMEKTIINRANDIENDILIENLKKFRRVLQDVGIGTVEDIDNYGKPVKFNIDIHEGSQLVKLNEGIVDSLGIKINDKNILSSTLLNID